MGDPAILFVRPRAISQRDKKMLQGAGIIIVEIDDPAGAKFVRAHTEISGGEMLTIACEVIGHNSNTMVREAFAKAICEAVLAKQKPTLPTD